MVQMETRKQRLSTEGKVAYNSLKDVHESISVDTWSHQNFSDKY